MNKRIDPNITIKEVTAPASKSYAQRAILAAALSKGTSKLFNLGKADDVVHILDVARQLGAEIVERDDHIEITGHRMPIWPELHVGESGLGVRMVTSIATALHESVRINGEGSLLERPMDQFKQFLPDLGVKIELNDGKLPLETSGILKGGEITIDGSLSSQFLTGLLMALPIVSKDSVVHVKDLKSKPYIRMTIDLMRDFGIVIDHNYDMDRFEIPGKQEYKACEYTVEGDWSAAAFWCVKGAIDGKMRIKGLNPKSLQADIKVLKAIVAAGGSFEWINRELIFHHTPLYPYNFDATHCPDLFPALTVLAAATEGTNTLAGVSRLKHKESDRGQVLQKEFHNFGLSIEIEGDLMRIHGNGKLNSNTLHSNNDHRIAMAGAIASLLTKEGIEVEQAEAVSKSYPEFWEVLENG